jgi:Tol biopolymer transport system component
MRFIALAVLPFLVSGCGERTASGQGAPERGAVSSEATDPDPVTTRRVWSQTDMELMGNPSPDGRYLTFTDWSTGDLAVRDLVSGENRLLTGTGGPEASRGFPEYSRISPDGRQVAYAWYRGPNYDLRVVDLEGGEPRVLYHSPEVRYVRPLTWSPDGGQVLANLFQVDQSTRMALLSLADGSVRLLRSFDWRAPLAASFSPDGRHIAYDVPTGEDSTVREIHILATDGSRELPLVRDSAHNTVIAWTPDGRILYASSRDGTMGVWSIHVENGRATGAPELVKHGLWRAFPLGLTNEGNLYYGVTTGTQDLLAAGFDPVEGRVLSPPVRMSDRVGVVNSGLDWSRDGQFVVYLSNPGAVSGAQRSILVVQSTRTGQVREIVPDLGYVNPNIRVSPDGRSLLAPGRDDRGRGGLFRIDLHSGESTPLAFSDPRGGIIRFPAWAPDDRTIFYVLGDESGFRIVRHDLEGGGKKELHYVEEGLIGPFALSPDGAELVFGVGPSAAASPTLHLLSASGGEPREILRLSGAEIVRAVEWTPDGRHLVFGKGGGPTQGEKVELWLMGADGADPRPLGLAPEGVRILRVHPAGDQIGFTTFDQAQELWVMEGVSAGAQSPPAR